MNGYHWTQESTDQLKALWAEGLSASRIACRIPHATRNSILGKVHRLNLERRVPGVRATQTREERNARARAAHAAKRLLNGHTPTLAPISKARGILHPRLWKVRHAPPVARPGGKPVPIIEATGCRYIEGNTRLCCNARGFPWCSYHAKIVWGPL